MLFLIYFFFPSLSPSSPGVEIPIRKAGDKRRAGGSCGWGRRAVPGGVPPQLLPSSGGPPVCPPPQCGAHIGQRAPRMGGPNQPFLLHPASTRGRFASSPAPPSAQHDPPKPPRFPSPQEPSPNKSVSNPGFSSSVWHLWRAPGVPSVPPVSPVCPQCPHCVPGVPIVSPVSPVRPLSPLQSPPRTPPSTEPPRSCCARGRPTT